MVCAHPARSRADYSHGVGRCKRRNRAPPARPAPVVPAKAGTQLDPGARRGSEDELAAGSGYPLMRNPVAASLRSKRRAAPDLEGASRRPIYVRPQGNQLRPRCWRHRQSALRGEVGRCPALTRRAEGVLAPPSNPVSFLPSGLQSGGAKTSAASPGIAGGDRPAPPTLAASSLAAPGSRQSRRDDRRFRAIRRTDKCRTNVRRKADGRLTIGRRKADDRPTHCARPPDRA